MIPTPDPVAPTAESPDLGLSAPMSSTLRIPLSTLAMDGDESGSTVEPEVGDPVEFTVTGTVTSVENGTAVVTPETVNGEPLPKGDGSPADPTEDDMRSMAAATDDSGNDY